MQQALEILDAMDREALLTPALTSIRQRTLEAAAACVLKDRNNTYGPPENSFRDIAAGWSVIAGTEISATKVGLMMAWLKTVRAKDNPGHFDSFVDGAAYFSCAAECAEAEAK